MRLSFGPGSGYGTALVIVGALVFRSGEAVTVSADPDFAGASWASVVKLGSMADPCRIGSVAGQAKRGSVASPCRIGSVARQAQTGGMDG